MLLVFIVHLKHNFMKSFLRLTLTAMVIALFFSAFSVPETEAQILQEILNRMDKHNQSLQTLRSDVTMAKYNSQLKENDVTEGSVMYLPVKKGDPLIRIDWTKPVAETLAVVKGEYIIYRPRLSQYLTGKTKDAKGSGKANSGLAFMNMSKTELKTNYSIKYIAEETVSSGVKANRLELTPKKAASYKMAEIWVDANGMPVQAKVVEKNNDTTTILLHNVKKNGKINLSDFKVIVPPGTREIKG